MRGQAVPLDRPRLPFTGAQPATRETSRLAAEAASRRATCDRLKVYKAIQHARDRGLTDEEIADLTGLAPNTARPRRVELAALGVVVKAATRRRTKSGRTATIWIVDGWQAEVEPRATC